MDSEAAGRQTRQVPSPTQSTRATSVVGPATRHAALRPAVSSTPAPQLPASRAVDQRDRCCHISANPRFQLGQRSVSLCRSSGDAHSRDSVSSSTCPASDHHPGSLAMGMVHIHKFMNSLELIPRWILSSSQAAGQPQYQKVPREQKRHGAHLPITPAVSWFWHQGMLWQRQRQGIQRWEATTDKQVGGY